MTTLLRRWCHFLSCRRAVSTLEYAILAGVVVAGVGAAVVTFGDNISTAIEDIGTKVETGAGTTDTIKLN